MEKKFTPNQVSKIEIDPILHGINATVHVPGSKSLTNRALLVASLAEGTTVLTNALFSDDSIYFAEALQKLGFEVRLELIAQRNDCNWFGRTYSGEERGALYR